jgi:cbb3-type cytochrome oxidase subunit 3
MTRSAEYGHRMAAIVLACLFVALVAWRLWPEPRERRARPAPAPLKGVVLLGVVEGGRTPDAYRKYEIHLDQGRILLVHKQKISDEYDTRIESPHRLGGEMRGCEVSPLVPSPDLRYTAYCTQPPETGGRELPSDLVVVDAASQRKVLTATLPQKRRIDGIFWAPDSRAVAVLSTTQRMARGPLDLLSAIVGRPTPLLTTFVDTFDIQSQRHAEFLVRMDSEYGKARIVDWRY